MDRFSSKIPFLYRRVAANHYPHRGDPGRDKRRNSANVTSAYWRLLSVCIGDDPGPAINPRASTAPYWQLQNIYRKGD